MIWSILAFFTLLAGFFVIYPLLRKEPRVQSEEGQQANIVLFREQLSELDRQLADGEMDEHQYRELVAEQKRLLLADESDLPVMESTRSRGAWLLMGGLLLVPLLAFSLYQQLGASEDVLISELMEQRLANRDGESDAEIRQQLQQKIARRLQDQPDNVYYLVTLARMLLENGEFLQSSATYQRAVRIAPDDADLQAEYAQAAYFASGNRFSPEADSALESALALDPNNLTALGLKGIRAFESGDYLVAITSWQNALQAIHPSTPQAESLKAGIERAREQMGDSLPSLRVSVSLAPELTADSGQVIYVFAREWQGSPMPLAVARLQVADLPTTVTLDDSMAMPNGKLLSSADQVEVVARVSMTGSVAPSAGDLEGASEVLSMKKQGIAATIVIDRKL
ncbi:c-type cytochrome biogenesis protein CcmI [uncultured Porticoccus sp.]|uniref:c-type cytochrome biogenesis protein CcmI n=1 Tax=uncultured Porticoccus sp. TaxID=1256050 RepID=UPI0030DB12EF|tara:strand:- start:20054 stop:21244 length:1191 start_codon:yes stop_codon:yes gene_type:complete